MPERLKEEASKKKRKSSYKNENLTFQPKRPKSVPNFKKTNATFQDTQKTKKLTKESAPHPDKSVKPAEKVASAINAQKVAETQQKITSEASQIPVIAENQDHQSLPPQTAEKKPNSASPHAPESKICKKKPKRARSEYQPPKFTQKVVDQFNLTRQAFIEAKEKENKKLAEEEQKKRAYEERAKQFRDKMNLKNLMTNDEKLEILKQQKLQERKEREANYKLQMEAVKSKLENREFYMEKILGNTKEKQQQEERVKVLVKAFEVFRANNPEGNPAAIFSKAELQMIQEGLKE